MQANKVKKLTRLTIDTKWQGQGIYIQFPDHRNGELICVPHDTLIDAISETANYLNTNSWKSGRYNIAKPRGELLDKLSNFCLD